MTNQIVTVNVTQTVAPTPSQLQKTGAFISQGATTLVEGTYSLLTELGDLTPLLRLTHTIATLAWASNVVTVTTSVPHGFGIGEVFSITIAGATPIGYNGTYLATITGASTFTYPLVSNPGVETVPGTYIPDAVAEVTAMATTFFAQGSQQAVYVLEVGAVSDAIAISNLSDFITATKQFFYSYLVPRGWANEGGFLSLVADFESLTSKTYFFVTVTNSNYTSFDDPTMKDVFAMIEAPTIPSTEFSCAAPFHVSLNYDPSQANRVTPFAFSYLFGVTHYPTFENAAFLNTLKTANINWVGVGEEGGISNKVLFWGKMIDGRPFNYWYSVDWVQINGDLDLANAVINGSNTPANPLYYNQNGINRLQAVLARLMNRGITFGLVLGDVVQVALTATEFQVAIDAGTYAGKTVVNAIPFIPYSRANPGDYKIGKYSGLYVAYVPLRGFEQIILNINVSDFVAS